MDPYDLRGRTERAKMDDHDFQEHVRALKKRVSEISTRYSSNTSPETIFSNQLRGLKSQVDAMQERLTTYERSSPSLPSLSIPETFQTNSNGPYETQNHFSLPSGPLFWQLFENLRTDLRSIDSRVATLESSVSELEDRVDTLDPDRFTPPSSASGTDFNGFVGVEADVSHFGIAKDNNDLPELSPESKRPTMAYHTRPSQAGECVERFWTDFQPTYWHTQQRNSTEQRCCGDSQFLRLLELYNATSLELAKTREHNENLTNTVQRLTSQFDRPPNTPANGNAGRKANPPKQNHLLPHFQKLEDTLEIFCGIDAIKLNGFETMGTTGLTLSKADILRSTQALLAHFALQNLHEAVRDGHEHEHYQNLLVVAKNADTMLSARCMDGSAADNHHSLEPPKVKCESHGVVECIRCRKDRRRRNVNDYINKLPRTTAHPSIRDDHRFKDLLLDIQLGRRTEGTTEPKRDLQTLGHGERVEGLAFRDREITRLDEQLRIAQERLRASEENLNDDRVLLLETRQERDDLKQANSDLTTRIYEFEEDAYDYNSRLLTKEKQLGDLHNLMEQKNRALEVWERSWTQLHESSERESAKSRDRERLIAEERERNEYAMERTVNSHHKEMKSIQEFCEQKDGVICKQEQIISRGRKLLEEREREIEMLQRDLRVIRDDKEHAIRNAERTARLLEERTADLVNLKKQGERDRARPSSKKEENYMDAVEQQEPTDARGSRYPAVSFSKRDPQMPDRVSDSIHSERIGNTTGYQSDRGKGRRRNGSERHRRSRQDDSADGWSTRRVYNVHGGDTNTTRPSQAAPLNATFQPPLPAPVRVRRAESEANLRNASGNTDASPARKSLSKYKSMHEIRGSLQPYVESDVGSGGELN